MQIFTLENEEFEELLTALTTARAVGRYWRDGKMLIVQASSRFVLVSSPDNQTKIGVKPVRSAHEGEQVARHLLEREQSRGNRVEFTEREATDA